MHARAHMQTHTRQELKEASLSLPRQHIISSILSCSLCQTHTEVQKYRTSSTFKNGKNVQFKKKRKAGEKVVRNADPEKEIDTNIKKEENARSKRREMPNGKRREVPIQKWSHKPTPKKEKLPFKNEDKSTEVGETSLEKGRNSNTNWGTPIQKKREPDSKGEKLQHKESVSNSERRIQRIQRSMKEFHGSRGRLEQKRETNQEKKENHPFTNR